MTEREEEEKINALCKEFRSFYPGAVTQLHSGWNYSDISNDISDLGGWQGFPAKIYLVIMNSTFLQPAFSRGRMQEEHE